MAPYGFNMVSGLGSFHNVDQTVKQALGPFSSGSKDHGTHNTPIFPNWNFVLFQLGKILYFKPWCGKLKGLGKSRRTLNAPKGEACLDTKGVGRARFLICLRHMMF